MTPGSGVVRVRADNPSPMTLTGTNTYLLTQQAAGGHGTDGCIVVDPGPDLAPHIDTVVAEAAARGGVIGAIVTHRHLDHTGGVDLLVEATGCPVTAVDPSWCRQSEPIRADGSAPTWLADVGPALDLIATPGHTDDSICIRLPSGDLLTGDTILGHGWTVITHPEGSLGAYLDSLDRIGRLLPEVGRFLPGHGEVVDDPAAVLAAYVGHRHERLEQVRTAVEEIRATGAVTPHRIVERVYADTDPALWPAAEQSVRAMLEYLGEPGV